jgi:hypothetical protein
MLVRHKRTMMKLLMTEVIINNKKFSTGMLHGHGQPRRTGGRQSR